MSLTPAAHAPVSAATNPSTTLELPLQRHLPKASRLAFGCMGLGGSWDATDWTADHLAHAHAAVEAALDIGVTLFDHADIYTFGKAESVFGELLRRQPSLRDRIVLQSKCGIRFADAQGPKRYDLSSDYIVTAVEASLRRLGTDRLDLLLLHRPDPLMQPDEIAEAFQRLRSRGLVSHFGVSNMHAGQIAWLNRALDQPLVANQLELGLGHLEPIDAGTCFNDRQAGTRAGALAWGGTLELCQQDGIQLQAWSALARGRYTGDTAADPRDEPARALVHQLAEQHGVSPEGLVLAWLMRHPARIQPVIGTSQPARIRACGDALKLTMSRGDWYALYEAARGAALP
ncbi:aldo/keto reductase [Roseateles amylovorans]|uniref:Aldo/keto reductase n=1 Tax=Roseateles amylovorans TaxID=2978473 RepID=A0ABY6B289_9BURK|nr:aldo/keto reductase [Roseateles amylovorans]UXH79196.1 aldo/keto reductase [Roseateles amylovorans]